MHDKDTRTDRDEGRASLDEHEPLVSVGIPTYNRVDMLTRSVESVLAQDYCNLEVVISDNASTDETQAVCDEFRRRDGRVRYIRQPTNLGLTANYAAVFTQARGEIYMALADDDWLDPTYVSQCLRTLLAQPDLMTVCGKSRMYRDQQFLFEGDKHNLLQDSARQRVVRYFMGVGENVLLHGLMRRETVASVPPMPNALAGDWVYIASIVYKGKARTLESTAINKSVAGTSNTWASQTHTLGLPAYQAYLPYLAILVSVFKDIAWASPVYASAGRFGRLSLASGACRALASKFALWTLIALAGEVWYRLVKKPFPGAKTRRQFE